MIALQWDDAVGLGKNVIPKPQHLVNYSDMTRGAIFLTMRSHCNLLKTPESKEGYFYARCFGTLPRLSNVYSPSGFKEGQAYVYLGPLR